MAQLNPSYPPTREVASPVVGALATVSICVLQKFGINLDPGTAAAIIVFLMTTVFHITPSNQQVINTAVENQTNANIAATTKG